MTILMFVLYLTDNTLNNYSVQMAYSLAPLVVEDDENIYDVSEDATVWNKNTGGLLKWLKKFYLLVTPVIN